MELNPDVRRMMGIFMPFALSRRDELVDRSKRLVHYTTFEAAIGMLRSRKIWLRNVTTLNDYREVQYGLECLRDAYRSSAGKQFKSVLDSIFVGLRDDLEKIFESWIPYLQFGTFVVCLSEHDDGEDNLGRLSMWRAYGANCGAAVVVKNSPFVRASNALKAYTSPVAYLTPKEYEGELAKIADAISKEKVFVESLDRKVVWLHFLTCFVLVYYV